MHRPELLFGPYVSHCYRRGTRVTCLFRDGDCVVTGKTFARISWPRCRRIGHRGGSGLLVDEELARAVRRESVLAIAYWFGVGPETVWRWRQALGVPQWNTGSRLLRKQVNAVLADKARGKRLPADQVERRRQTAKKLRLRPLANGYGGSRAWTKRELRMLGTVPDIILARWIDRTPLAVRVMRTRLGLPTRVDRRRTKTRKR
jgi:hypothetical protein